MKGFPRWAISLASSSAFLLRHPPVVGDFLIDGDPPSLDFL